VQAGQQQAWQTAYAVQWMKPLVLLPADSSIAHLQQQQQQQQQRNKVFAWSGVLIGRSAC
jgi:hypothetical protein